MVEVPGAGEKFEHSTDWMLFQKVVVVVLVLVVVLVMTSPSFSFRRESK